MGREKWAALPRDPVRWPRRQGRPMCILMGAINTHSSCCKLPGGRKRVGWMAGGRGAGGAEEGEASGARGAGRVAATGL